MTLRSNGPSAAYLTWAKRIAAYDQGEPIPENLIVAMRSLLRRSAPHPLIVSNKGERIQDARNLLLKRFTHGGPVTWRVESAQALKGRRWLQLPKVRRMLSDECRKVVDDFHHFLFVGLFLRDTGYASEYLPIYRVVGYAGKFFDYTASPWQSDECRFLVLDGKYAEGGQTLLGGAPVLDYRNHEERMEDLIPATGGNITEEALDALERVGCQAPAFIQTTGGCDLNDSTGNGCCYVCDILVRAGRLGKKVK